MASIGRYLKGTFLGKLLGVKERSVIFTIASSIVASNLFA